MIGLLHLVSVSPHAALRLPCTAVDGGNLHVPVLRGELARGHVDKAGRGNARLEASRSASNGRRALECKGTGEYGGRFFLNSHLKQPLG